MDELEVELKLERENGNRLAAALRLLLAYQRKEDSILYSIVGPPDAQLTLGHVVDGALALHDAAEKARSEL